MVNTFTLNNKSAASSASGTDILPVVNPSTGAIEKMTYTNLFASPQPLGSTTPSTGAFTSLSTTGNISGSSSSGNMSLTLTTTTNSDDVIIDFDVPQSPLRFRAFDGTSGYMTLNGVGGFGDIMQWNYSNGRVVSYGEHRMNAGISFDSGTNILDEYEEGTWTPVPQGTSTAGTPLGSFSGRYTRIGRMCYISCRCDFSDTADMAGNFEIEGLPFTIDGATDSRCGFSSGFRNGYANDYPIIFYGQNGTTKVQLYRADVDATRITVSDLGVAAGTDIYFSGFFEIA